MTWTYSGDPASSIQDRVRFLIGDTDTEDPQFQDAEILFLISSESNELGAAAGGCEALAMRFARLCDRSMGRALSVSASQQYEHYQQQSITLRRQACQSHAPTAGGISIGSERLAAANPDAKQPVFSRDMMASNVEKDSHYSVE